MFNYHRHFRAFVNIPELNYSEVLFNMNVNETQECAINSVTYLANDRCVYGVYNNSKRRFIAIRVYGAGYIKQIRGD